MKELTIDTRRLVFDQETGRYALKDFRIAIKPDAIDWLFQKAMNNQAAKCQAMKGAFTIEVQP